MDWKNPFIQWLILTAGLTLTVYLLVQALIHIVAIIDEQIRGGPAPTPSIRRHSKLFEVNLLFAAAVAAALIVFRR